MLERSKYRATFEEVVKEIYAKQDVIRARIYRRENGVEGSDEKVIFFRKWKNRNGNGSNNGGFNDEKSEGKIKWEKNRTKEELDRLENRMLELKAENKEVSYIELAKVLGCSAGVIRNLTTRARLRKENEQKKLQSTGSE